MEMASTTGNSHTRQQTHDCATCHAYELSSREEERRTCVSMYMKFCVSDLAVSLR